ncbi:DoxX family protein [Zobellia alginiliquefaciens]|uniref:DoxX family protein n=1 Tax=Zobellia alginiliquefaciens TaxID=3032586 RepID=UPI0023E3AE96|nr:DoxX family protein [Zobellia alginiliquefaciens]
MKTNKRNKIIYWLATSWLSLGMLSTGVVQLLQLEENIQSMESLGYPLYLLSILGVWKFLGVIAILIPKLPLLKEWAYAGFVFVMTGAIVSHLAVGDDSVTFFGPSLLLVLTFISWYFRPANRKLI